MGAMISASEASLAWTVLKQHLNAVQKMEWENCITIITKFIEAEREKERAALRGTDLTQDIP